MDGHVAQFVVNVSQLQKIQSWTSKNNACKDNRSYVLGILRKQLCIKIRIFNRLKQSVKLYRNRRIAA